MHRVATGVGDPGHQRIRKAIGSSDNVVAPRDGLFYGSVRHLGQVMVFEGFNNCLKGLRAKLELVGRILKPIVPC
jgi:hypothetical protein